MSTRTSCWRCTKLPALLVNADRFYWKSLTMLLVTDTNQNRVFTPFPVREDSESAPKDHSD